MQPEDGEIYTTCISRSSDTCTMPDLLVASPGCCRRATLHIQDYIGSDHMALLGIFPTIQQPRPPKRNQPRRNWNFKRANWLTFMEVIDFKMRSAPWRAPVAIRIIFFNQCLLYAAKVAIPRFPALDTHQSHSPALKRFRRLRKAALRKFLRSRADEDWVECKRL